MPRGESKALSNFPSGCFWSKTRHALILSSQVVARPGPACLCALICMPVWLTHSVVNFSYPWGSGCARITLASHSGFKTQTNTSTHCRPCACRVTPTDTPERTCRAHTHRHGSAFQFSAQLHSTVTYSNPRFRFSLRTHTHLFNAAASHLSLFKVRII